MSQSTPNPTRTQPNARAVPGTSSTLDSDGDGAKDNVDACPFNACGKTAGDLGTYYADRDGDGFGDSSDAISFCCPSGCFTATVGDDCNDANSGVKPTTRNFEYVYRVRMIMRASCLRACLLLFLYHYSHTGALLPFYFTGTAMARTTTATG
jgi:hypothetical protein